MSVLPWKATEEVNSLLNSIKEKNHSPKLDAANIVVAFEDSKPFKNGALNWGKTLKFSHLNKLWQQPNCYDFCIVVPSDIWHSILSAEQKEPYLDLRLTCCHVEYEPETIVENKKTIKVKDEFGRVQYTDQMKFDDEGRPKWKVLPLDLHTYSQNVGRYGLWCGDLLAFNKAANNDKNATDEVYLEKDATLNPRAFKFG